MVFGLPERPAPAQMVMIKEECAKNHMLFRILGGLKFANL
jgi:hypothetical protein